MPGLALEHSTATAIRFSIIPTSSTTEAAWDHSAIEGSGFPDLREGSSYYSSGADNFDFSGDDRYSFSGWQGYSNYWDSSGTDNFDFSGDGSYSVSGWHGYSNYWDSSGADNFYFSGEDSYSFSGWHGYSNSWEPEMESPCHIDLSADDNGYLRQTQIPVFHPGSDDQIDVRITGNWLLAGLAGVMMSILSGYLYMKKSPLDGNVTLVLLLTCFFRFFAGLSKIYDAICIWSWHCVVDQVDVFYWGMGLNTVIASLEMSFYYSMHLALHCLTIDRAILAFFGIGVYRFARYVMIVYGIIVSILPLIPIWLMLGTIRDNDLHCWGGFWFDPTYLALTITKYQNEVSRELFDDLRTLALLIISFTLVLNLATFWRFKYLTMVEKWNLIAAHNPLLVMMLGFSNLSFFFDELLIGLTQNTFYVFKRSDVTANIAKSYRYHASVIVTGILFVCYGYACGDEQRREKKRDVITVSSSMPTMSASAAE
ncbi:unnamed protein product, partial [Mesorhabditis spiculigera]